MNLFAKKALAILLLISLTICLSACSNEPVEPSSTPEPTKAPAETPIDTPEPTEPPIEHAVQGRRIVVGPNDVVFWGYGPYLCSALIDETGMIYDTVIEAQFRADIQSLAILDGWLYVGSNDGLFRYELAKFAEGSVEPQQITDREIDYGFQIYGDTAYYEYGYTVYCAPITGGEEGEAAHNMDEFVVTSEGIYFSAHGGGLYLVSLDGAQQNRLAQTPEYCKLSLVGRDIYFRCEKNDQISYYCAADGSTTLVNKMNSLSDYSYIWANEDYLLFETSGYDVYSYNFAEGSETLISGKGSYPEIEDGFLYGNRLYSLSYDGGSVSVYDLENAQCATADVKSVLDGFIKGQQQGSSSGGFDICEDMEVLSASSYDVLMCRHFKLNMPKGLPWHWEQINSTTVILYYTPAYVSFGGGKLVSIRAYDHGDESYKDIPAWTLAGQTDEKVFIAIYPTDVQFDPADPTQAEEYMILSEHLAGIANLKTPFEIFN